MFSGYLSVREACEACKMAFEPLRSDDAPPYFTLFIVGHLVISLYLLLWPYMPYPDWVHARDLVQPHAGAQPRHAAVCEGRDDGDHLQDQSEASNQGSVIRVVSSLAPSQYLTSDS